MRFFSLLRASKIALNKELITLSIKGSDLLTENLEMLAEIIEMIADEVENNHSNKIKDAATETQIRLCTQNLIFMTAKVQTLVDEDDLTNFYKIYELTIKTYKLINLLSKIGILYSDMCNKKQKSLSVEIQQLNDAGSVQFNSIAADSNKY